jgi:hypothetical protein
VKVRRYDRFEMTAQGVVALSRNSHAEIRSRRENAVTQIDFLAGKYFSVKLLSLVKYARAVGMHGSVTCMAASRVLLIPFAPANMTL